MNLSKHLVLIAGEESGDQHAAKLLKTLKQTMPNLVTSGLGGAHLQAQGMNCLLDLTKLAITGVTGVLGHLSAIRDAFFRIKQHLLDTRPDLVILVDYPGFNLRMAKWIKQHLNCPVIYYVSPQIWAWKAKRIETIRKYVDHMAVILPFEYDLYRSQNIPVTYVGHPLMDSLAKVPNLSACREHFSLALQQKILALCPGSRTMEISRLMPVMVRSLKLLQQRQPNLDLKLVIPVAKSIDPEFINRFCQDLCFPYELIEGQAQMVMQAADAVVVASGTASLEAALLQKPSCIIYKSSWINYYLARRWMKVKYLGLANLLLNQMAIPELLQMDCEDIELSKMIENILFSPDWQQRFARDLANLTQILSIEDSNILSKLVLSYL